MRRDRETIVVIGILTILIFPLVIVWAWMMATGLVGTIFISCVITFVTIIAYKVIKTLRR